MSEYVKVKGMEMVRDTKNNSLINQNKHELDNYLNKRKKMIEQKEEINSIKSEVSSLKDDMGEIKNLLIQLIKDKPNNVN
jgi:ubiquinone biosynthesis protein UbiJ